MWYARVFSIVSHLLLLGQTLKLTTDFVHYEYAMFYSTGPDFFDGESNYRSLVLKAMTYPLCKVSLIIQIFYQIIKIIIILLFSSLIQAYYTHYDADFIVVLKSFIV